MRLAAMSIALVLPTTVRAQAMTGPAPILVVGREVVKPGKAIAHAKWEAAWSRSLEAAKSPLTIVGLTALDGPNEVWFVLPYGSLADMQKSNEAGDANPALAAVAEKYVPAESDFLTDMRSMILTYRADLSYQTGRPISEMRYVTVQRILVRAGHNAEFVEARTAVKAAHEKAKLPDGFAIYSANGMPAGTFYVLAARKSLAEVDDNAKTHQDPAYQAALGADWTKRNAALVAAYEQSSDLSIFAASPAMSVVPKEWKDADPFWKPKEPAKKAP
jgi:hypothetical protein